MASSKWLELLKEVAISVGADVAVAAALRTWWEKHLTKTLDSTHRGDVGRVFASMDSRGLGEEVTVLLHRLRDRSNSRDLPTEDSSVRALHEYIPKRDEWREKVRVTSVDWDRLDEAVNAFVMLAGMTEEDFIAALNAAIHDPIRQRARVVAHVIAEGSRAIAAGAAAVAPVIDNEVFERLNHWLDGQRWVRR